MWKLSSHQNSLFNARWSPLVVYVALQYEEFILYGYYSRYSRYSRFMPYYSRCWTNFANDLGLNFAPLRSWFLADGSEVSESQGLMSGESFGAERKRTFSSHYIYYYYYYIYYTYIYYIYVYKLYIHSKYDHVCTVWIDLDRFLVIKKWSLKKQNVESYVIWFSRCDHPFCGASMLIFILQHTLW